MITSTLLLSALLLMFPRQLLGLIFGKVGADVMHAAITYLIVTSFSYPFLAIYSAGAAIFRSFGNSSVSMRISFIMNISNIILNYIFVFVFNLKVLGVALATLISQFIACVIMTILLKSSKNQIKPFNFVSYIPKKKYISKILYIGVPSGIENGMFQFGKLIVVGMIATLGTSEIAANSIATQIIDFPNIPASCIGIAMITIVGQCMGANNLSLAKAQTKRLMKYAYICDWISKGLLFIFAPQIVSIFSLSDEASNSATLLLRSFFIAAIIVWPLSFTLPNTLRTSGDVKFTMTVSIISMWLCRIVASYIFIFYLDLRLFGVWLGMYIDWYIRGTFYLLRYLSNKWAEHHVI